MKYHPIFSMDKKDAELLIEEIAQIVFDDFKEGQQLTVGQIMAAMVKTVDIVMTKRFY